MIEKKHMPIMRVTNGPKHHFFGYFDKFPWNFSGRYLLANQSDFMGRQPEAGEKLTLGMIDLEDNNRFIPFATTSAWCWQQGCMLQYLADDDNCVIYNDIENGKFVSRIQNVFTGEKRTLHRPIYTLSPDGRYALSLNFSRLDKERPGYGYPGAFDPFEFDKIPAADGLWLVDLKNDTSKLIVSVSEITKMFYRSDMEDTPGWFNHLLFSPDSKRIAFFHRWRVWDKQGNPDMYTHMFTANIDGTDIYPLNLEEFSSHYTWVNDRQIINFSSRYLNGKQYYLYTDGSRKTEIIGKDEYPTDGHCSYSSDKKWMLTDTFPLEDRCHRLYLRHLESGKIYEIGSFHCDPTYPGPTRCDLHPNWSRDDRFVCIDAAFEGTRQMYIIDVSELTKQDS